MPPHQMEKTDLRNRNNKTLFKHQLLSIALVKNLSVIHSPMTATTRSHQLMYCSVQKSFREPFCDKWMSGHWLEEYISMLGSFGWGVPDCLSIGMTQYVIVPVYTCSLVRQLVAHVTSDFEPQGSNLFTIHCFIGVFTFLSTVLLYSFFTRNIWSCRY